MSFAGGDRVVRFKVIKGSQLLLYIAIAILVLVIGGLALSYFLSGNSRPVSARANLVQSIDETTAEAKTHSVFASAGSDGAALELDPQDHSAIDVEIIPQATQAVDADKPTVLIYHTHSHEAYEQVASDQYVAIEAWRTTDQDHSVVRVGEELAELLRDRGFDVVHDTTDHEQNDLKTAYTRSLATLEQYEERFDLYIDLHRDAYIEGMNDTPIWDGDQSLAHIMMLIGNGEGFTVKPFYPENLAFAQALTERVNALKEGLCKDVLVKDGRYNQNIGVFSILIEVGHNRNTLREALSALPFLADGLKSLMIDAPDPELLEIRQTYLSELS